MNTDKEEERGTMDSREGATRRRESRVETDGEAQRGTEGE